MVEMVEFKKIAQGEPSVSGGEKAPTRVSRSKVGRAMLQKGAEASEPILMGQSKWADQNWPSRREPRRDDQAERADLKELSQVGQAKESRG